MYTYIYDITFLSTHVFINVYFYSFCNTFTFVLPTLKFKNNLHLWTYKHTYNHSYILLVEQNPDYDDNRGIHIHIYVWAYIGILINTYVYIY